MKLEDQVVSLELAKKLKELGVKQESLFAYVLSESGTINGESYENKIIFTHAQISNSPNKWSAFTIIELGEMLPVCITIKENEPFNNFRINITKASLFETTELKINYLINYKCDTTEITGEQAWLSRELFEHNLYDTNLANLLGKTLIYLIENKLIEI